MWGHEEFLPSGLTSTFRSAEPTRLRILSRIANLDDDDGKSGVACMPRLARLKEMFMEIEISGETPNNKSSWGSACANRALPI
jgi:hypothetical protein